VFTGFEVILVAMPRANDVHVIFIEALTQEDAAFADDIHDLGQAEALTRRSALMGAQILVRVEATALMDHTDLKVVVVENPHLTICDLTSAADEMLTHCILPK
jgi:hypothetical protein